jgi:PPK2 family polyphosphate:nucleotide phosphotransferase
MARVKDSTVSDALRIEAGTRVDLIDRDAAATPGVRDRDEAEAALRENLEELIKLQYLLYAENKHALLVVLQAMDAGGKDGVIRHVMSGLNPSGCHVTSFKKPTADELEHDFLWRIHREVPRRGDIGVFNRSHYEDVLVVRVHELVPERVWRQRFGQINAFEQQLIDNHVVIRKFFLHISKEEQRERLQARLDDPTKHWKITPEDASERRHWDAYVEAFEDAISKCSTKNAPWFVIPSDRKWYRNFAISQILLETLRGLDMEFPPPTCDVSKIRID